MLQIVALLLLSQQPFEPFTEGIATYYTVESSSTLTASGETMQDDLYTCAMRDGEFGGYYFIAAENGESVICRLNDRGPYVKGRVIDLSEAAMRKLHAKAGMVRVKVYKVGLDLEKFPDLLSLNQSE